MDSHKVKGLYRNPVLNPFIFIKFRIIKESDLEREFTSLNMQLKAKNFPHARQIFNLIYVLSEFIILNLKQTKNVVYL